MALLTAQRDSYLTEIQATVVSCELLGSGHAVVLDDTPFYPESGGQPSDSGSVGGRTVTSVARRADGAVVHVIAERIEPGTKVTARIDWRRRFDLMQQHTAQHIFTAIAQDRFGFNTTAFHLGEHAGDVELDSPAIARPKLLEIESAVNGV
ncbi:MAG: alanyl-tRNA editing protein, partial [Myxococcota bacterium]